MGYRSMLSGMRFRLKSVGCFSSLVAVPDLALRCAGPALHVLLGNVTSVDERAQERAFLWHYLAIDLGGAGWSAGAVLGFSAAVRFLSARASS